jgi:hypothetical protein
MVLVHGGNAGAWVWDLVLPDLEFPALVVDLPGHGKRIGNLICGISASHRLRIHYRRRLACRRQALGGRHGSMGKSCLQLSGTRKSGVKWKRQTLWLFRQHALPQSNYIRGVEMASALKTSSYWSSRSGCGNPGKVSATGKTASLLATRYCRLA